MPGVTAEQVLDRIRAAILEASSRAQDSHPVKPGHRVAFHWPPHGVSYDYHVLPTAWSSIVTREAYGETLTIEIAKTEQGVFARVDGLWNEAKAESEEQAINEAVAGCGPYFARQDAISAALGLPYRFKGKIDELAPEEWVVLLYCSDRDVARSAMVCIEKKASTAVFTKALVEILRDNSHPYRRSAQWCVLDMFEDIAAFCKDCSAKSEAVVAIKDLIWTATDDYARTVFKAGVVLGGHICDDDAADALIACFEAPSKFGRRSAIHASFHLCEWMPERREQVVAALRVAAENDPEPALREFASHMAEDVATGASDHMAEPFFEGEA